MDNFNLFLLPIHTANINILYFEVLGNDKLVFKFESYFTSKEMFDLWKEKQLQYYADEALTEKQYPELDATTRMKLRNELLEKQFKSQE